MIVDIEGTNLPGRSCAPADAPRTYDNIHVGLGLRAQPFDLVPGDAPAAHWQVEVATPTVNGARDFRGRFVHGPRGDRFLYLNWGTVAEDGTFSMFRRAKLILDAIPAELVDQAASSDRHLVASVNLTDQKGNPLCARVRPPAITWRLAD
jgi:hypothetical protein